MLDIFPDVEAWSVIDSCGFKVSEARTIVHQIEGLGRRAMILTPLEIFRKSEQNPRTLFVVFGSLYMMREFLQNQSIDQ